MPRGSNSILAGQLNRLAVFSAVKNFMAEYGEDPTTYQIAEISGLPQTTVERHMHALHRATGLENFTGHSSGQHRRREWRPELIELPELLEMNP